jgi:hypothetical protein
MRLTLRTLLAYLDNTLEPQDAEVLRQKVEQSGFATQLVQRIRGSLTDRSLSAPAPDSVHPIEEPNMMSNYLDSTLPPEQTAEIEKACLESVPHLAEAAACHQILTMVLGQPAEVSERLRQRVFAMVDLGGNIVESESGAIAGRLGVGAGPPPIAGEIGPRFSSVELPGGAANVSQEATRPEAIVDPREGPPQDVRPVGVDDSGVFQVATKFRGQTHQFAEAGTAFDDAGLLADDPSLKELDPADFYEDEKSKYRLTPWLVTLALVGTLLFAIVQIFAPLIGPKVADRNTQSTAPDGLSSVEPSEETGGQVAVEVENAASSVSAEEASAASVAPSSAPLLAGEETMSAAETVEPTTQPDAASVMSGRPTPTGPTEEVADSIIDVMTPGPDGQVENADPVMRTEVSDASTETSTDAAEMPDARVAALPAEPGLDPSVPNAESPEMDPLAAPVNAEAAMAAGTEAAPPDGAADIAPDADASGSGMAVLVSDKALVAMRTGDADWRLVSAADSIPSDRAIVCGPEYRATFVLTGDPESSVTLVGPAEVRWLRSESTVSLGVRFGRGVIKLADPGSSVEFVIGDTKIVAKTESAGAIIAFDVSLQRDLGADPLVSENHHARVELTSVTGDFSVSGFDEVAELGTGAQVVCVLDAAGANTAEVTKPVEMPSWIDPEIESGSLDSEAAANLLELVRTDGSGSLLLSLRVALGFRRNEVAALAGRTMLAFSDGSAYFGVDGLLSQPRQRLYWSSHLDALRSTIDRSVADAKAVRTAIAGQNAAMDNADGDTLFRLLIGYSQEQLENGGDQELVAGLESGSIPVRVLASESLRDISGTTMFFKPEEEVASRREEVIKKWKVRLRKEAIRYPETE